MITVEWTERIHVINGYNKFHSKKKFDTREEAEAFVKELESDKYVSKINVV